MKKILKIAYKMPPQENWNEFRDCNQKNPNFITEEHYKRIVDAGFTHGMGLLEHGADIAERALQTAERVGLKYYVRDAINWANILHPDYYYYNGENYKKYMKYKSFAGIYIYDEPNITLYPSLAKMVKGYNDFFKGIGEPLINLLPTYASHVEQLGASSYEEYIEEYIRQVPTTYVLYDHYPFRVRNRVEEFLNSDYLYNCKVVAEACKRHGKQLRTFIQSSVMDRGETDFLPEMIDFQIHTQLAHGSQAMVYYFYWGDESDILKAGLVDWKGNPTDLYYGAKKIHGELAKYEDKYLDCKWENARYVKGYSEHHNEEEFARIGADESGEYKSKYDCVVGEFAHGDGKALYIVNYTSPRLCLENEIEFVLDEDSECYVNGDKIILTKGKNKIKIKSGGGAFIIPAYRG
ncbi:MAG: hypothetical protein IKA61_01410 [Clostridia bacterium]|nr:hypothetical protein [Clostridia bacterium]